LQATECLVKLGHRKIGMITGPAGWKSVNDRTEGYRLALEEVGIPFDASLIEQGDWSYQGGYEAMRHLLAKAPRITGLFAQNDQMAIGAMRALREAGRRIPDDMALVGYDDIPAAAYCHPPLTTIRQPMQQVGEVATRLLIELVDDPTVERKEVLMKTELVRRETCGS